MRWRDVTRLIKQHRPCRVPAHHSQEDIQRGALHPLTSCLLFLDYLWGRSWAALVRWPAVMAFVWHASLSFPGPEVIRELILIVWCKRRKNLPQFWGSGRKYVGAFISENWTHVSHTLRSMSVDCTWFKWHSSRTENVRSAVHGGWWDANKRRLRLRTILVSHLRCPRRFWTSHYECRKMIADPSQW